MIIQQATKHIRPLNETWELKSPHGLYRCNSTEEVIDLYERAGERTNLNEFVVNGEYVSYYADDGRPRSKTKQVVKGAALGGMALGLAAGFFGIGDLSAATSLLAGGLVGAVAGGTTAALNYEPREQFNGKLVGYRTDEGIKVFLKELGGEVGLDLQSMVDSPRMKAGEDPDTWWNRERQEN